MVVIADCAFSLQSPSTTQSSRTFKGLNAQSRRIDDIDRSGLFARLVKFLLLNCSVAHFFVPISVHGDVGHFIFLFMNVGTWSNFFRTL